MEPPDIAEWERVQADANRYRWLRNKSLGQFTAPIAVSQKRTGDCMTYVGPLCGKELDSAIDAAISKGE